MPYFTSWDVNALLCLVFWGLPDDVVKRMMKMMKKKHEVFSLERATTYWVSNSPSIVSGRLKFIHGGLVNESEYQYRMNTWQNRHNLTIEFKTQWRLRSIEERKAKVVQWCKFGDEQEQLRHQGRLRKSSNKSYIKNLWKSWEAGAWGRSSYYLVGWDKRVYISQWYEGIHPGRFFLFYKENKIIEERHKGVRAGKGGGYQFPKTPIFDWGPYEQLIEDLRCIDGPGLGESGSKIEHIDDLFLD